MTGKVSYGRNARQDFVLLYRLLVREAGVRVADRFLESAEATFVRLATMPHLGARYEQPALADLRYLPLPGRFKKYLVFYRPTYEGIEIARILHGSRDISSLLTDEFGTDDGEGE